MAFRAIGRLLFVLEISVLLAVLGAALAFFVFIFVMEAAGVSNINGGLAMGAANTIAPAGGLIAGLLGLYFGYRLAVKIGDRAATATAFSVLGFIGAVVGAIYLHDELTDGDPYDLDGPRPYVLFEIRVPEVVPPGMADRLFRKSMRTYTTTATVLWRKPRQRPDGESTILNAEAVLYWRVSNRAFVFWRARNGPRHVFDLGLPPEPDATPAFGPWRRADWVEDAESGEKRDPPEGPGIELRYRVVVR